MNHYLGRMIRTYSLIVFFLIFSGLAHSQDGADPYALQDSLDVSSDIFAEPHPAEITLRYDMKEFRKRSNADKYLKAELIYHLGDTLPDIKHIVRIKARGKNRQEVCSFPPIWINIRKADIQNRNLQETKRIKLVTHCGRGKSFENYVLKEFLAYKIYNLISPFSFRVRLVRMKYVDTGRKDRITENWAFLIEPESMLAERLDMVPLKMDNVSITQTDTLWTSTMSIFQFMIGKADYSVAGRHNVKLLKYNDYTKPNVIPVPYDFDYSGLVNAHYAVPGDNLGVGSVRERYFLGPCRTEDYYRGVIDSFINRKEGILELVRSFEHLSKSDKENVALYLEEFFNDSRNNKYIKYSILSTCR